MIKFYGIINGGTISNNKTITDDGGGIRVDGKLEVNSGNIINNSANRNGGGIDWTYGVLFWNDGKLEENSAKGEGENLNPKFSDESNNWINFERLNITPIDVAIEKKYTKKTDISDISLQGMTVTDKYLVFAQMKAENENTKINIIDKNTYEILNSVDDYCFGHANNIAYNFKDGKCYMSYSKDNKSYVTSFKINDNQQLEDVNTKELDRSYFALTYDEDDNYFIGMSGDEIFIIDENFDNIIRKFKYSERDLTKQDIMYYKGYIYFACWEAGEKTKYQTNFNNREKNSNVIYVYNMDGILQKTLYISNKEAFGEIEGVAVDSNGKLILGYNTESWKSISFYSSNYLNGVDSIKISSLPLKNKYIQNYENLDLTGGELTVNYNNGTSDKLSLTNENIKVSGFDNSKIGKNKITVQYEGKSAEYEIEIISKTNTIEENLNNNSNNQPEKQKENVDNTIARTEIPKAGKAKVMVTLIISLCLFFIFLVEKLRKYNDIKE